MQITVINGPNINLLKIREPSIYGSISLQDNEKKLTDLAKSKGIDINFFQSNHEGELVDYIQSQHGNCDGIIINAAAYTHTSIAIRDALLAVSIPFIEVHLSNIFSREPFRQKSLLSDIAKGIVCGFGDKSYELALLAF